MATTEALERRGRGAEHSESPLRPLAELARGLPREILDVRCLLALRPDQHQACERWIVELATRGHFFRREGGEIMGGRGAQRIVTRLERLNEDTARLGSAAGAAGNLREQLKSTLGRPKVGEVER